MGGGPVKQLGELGEFGLIRDLARRLEREPAAPTVGKVCLGIGDDAAILELPPEHRLVVTADALIEDVHFRRDWSSARELGWKALAVNVSDLGAMGARPVGAVVTLGLPRGTDAGWVRELYAGLGECAKAYGCPIVGGDTVRAPTEVALSVTALGAVPAGRAVTRAGARPGDLVCVTGVLGES
ncbi:MAG: thiamine-phosphate kinase, partial [Armatimonadetes bacterium]|nr:thiamine-phosphate kinase [Armatimonadota bacterium]